MSDSGIAPSQKAFPEYRYDAFISYRHVEPDRGWAQWLHSALETYRVPTKLRQERGLPARIDRIFRDEEELPASSDLNNEIETALVQSRYLIVVCSPKTPESRWVNREVERFRELGRHDRILALLVAGEPAESFPRAMVEIRRNVIDAQGGASERIEEVEPLAADVRESRNESVRHLKRMARLRMMAILLGCRFDDLRQREQERRARRLTQLGVVLGLMLLTVGAMAIYAFKQRGEARLAQVKAERAQQIAEDERRRAEIELAHAIVLQGDTLGQADRWPDAVASYLRAQFLLDQSHEPALAAKLGLWDARRHVPPALDTLTSHTDPLLAVAMSADDRRILSADRTGHVKLWDAATGRVIRELQGNGASISTIGFLPDGNRALTAGADPAITLWDLETGAVVRRIAVENAPINALVVATKGSTFFTAAEDGTIGRWDSQSALLHSYKARESVKCVALSRDDTTLACGTVGGNLITLSAERLDNASTLRAHDFFVSGVAFLPDAAASAHAPAPTSQPAPNYRVVTVSFDNKSKVWDLATGKALQTLNNVTSGNVCVATTPNGRVLTGDWAAVLKLWDLPTAKALYTMVGHSEGMARGVAVTATGQTAISAGDDKTLRLWDLAGGREARQLEGFGAVTGVQFSPDQQTVMLACSTGPLLLYDQATEKLLRTYGKIGVFAIGAGFSHDGRHVACGGLADVSIWDLSQPDRPPTVLKGHTEMVMCAAFSPDGSVLISGSADKTARVWDVASGTEKLKASFEGQVNAVDVSPDGKTALAVTMGGVRIWEIATGKEIRTIKSAAAPGPQSAFSAAAFSPDGRSILAGTHGGGLRLLDITSGADIRPILGAHAFYVLAVRFSPDGKVAASASQDGSVRLWEISTGRPVRALTGHAGKAQCLAFSADGNALLSGGDEGSAWVWDFRVPDVDDAIESELQSARAGLLTNPKDAAALITIGKARAVHRLDRWAIECFSQAQAAGGTPPALAVARCHWRLGNLDAAKRSFELALQRNEAAEPYLRLCLAAVGREARPASKPTSQPSTAPN